MSEFNTKLENAYLQIQKRYADIKKELGHLKKIGFRNKWNYIVTEENQVGLAFNFTADHAVYGPVDNMEQFIRLQPYVGKSLPEFIEYLLSRREIQMRSICLAALNALSQPLINNYLEQDRSVSVAKSVTNNESFDFIEPEDVVTIVGYGGVAAKIYGKCKELHISDMRPRHLLNTLTIGEEIEYGPEKIIFHSATDNERILAGSDVVMITGCTLVNGTFQELIKFSQKARVIGMYGPSAGIIPDFLIDCGINYISSARVCSAQLAYHLANAPDLTESFKSCMEPYIIRKF